MSDDGEIPNLNAKPGDVLTTAIKKSTSDWQEALKKYYEKQPPKPPRHNAPTRRELLANIIKMGQDRIAIREEKAYYAKIQPGVEYGKHQTAIEELKIFLDLIREVKV